MDIKSARIGMMVTHPSYGEAKIYLIREDGNVSLRTISGTNICGVGINRCEPIATDACESCQKIIELQKECDNWKEDAKRYCCNAAYWREELTKLQKEVLSDREEPVNCVGAYIPPAIHIEDFRKRPLGEVAKIDVTARIDASQMLAGMRRAQWKLLSDDAKIICELLEGQGPLASWQIAERLHLMERCVLENLIEARSAGKVCLNKTGEYELVKED